MAQTTPKRSPAGRPATQAARRRRDDPEYRRIHAEIAAFERLARVVILRRDELDLTQKQLADRMGTTASVISRIESGQHTTSVTTLQRLAAALGGVVDLDLRFDEPAIDGQRPAAGDPASEPLGIASD